MKGKKWRRGLVGWGQDSGETDKQVPRAPTESLVPQAVWERV